MSESGEPAESLDQSGEVTDETCSVLIEPGLLNVFTVCFQRGNVDGRALCKLLLNLSEQADGYVTLQ